MVGVILPFIFQPSWTKRVVCLTRLLSDYGASQCSVREVFYAVVYFYHSYLSVITTLWTPAALQLQTGNNATSFGGTRSPCHCEKQCDVADHHLTIKTWQWLVFMCRQLRYSFKSVCVLERLHRNKQIHQEKQKKPLKSQKKSSGEIQNDSKELLVTALTFYCTWFELVLTLK